MGAKFGPPPQAGFASFGSASLRLTSLHLPGGLKPLIQLLNNSYTKNFILPLIADIIWFILILFALSVSA